VTRLRGPATTAAVGAGLLVVTESLALARFAGAGWPAAWSIALGVLAALAVAGSLTVAVRAPVTRYWVTTRRVLAVAASGAVLAESAVLAWWLDVRPAGQGLAVAVTGAVLIGLSTVPVPPRLLEPVDLRVVAALGCLLALPAAALDADRLWLALLAVGVAVTAVGLREDSRWGWLAGGLLTASSWVRLADAHVDAPEAYTVLPATALLVVGALRRRRDARVGSWAAYSTGLLLGLVPSLLRAVTDAGTTRPLLLGLAAGAVLAVGVARRLQAPLLVGGTVLAVDALVQLAPYLVAAYDAVPRWVTIGLAGLALVGAGATYERRVHDLRRVGRHLTRLG